jgi:hypothetical protein
MFPESSRSVLLWSCSSTANTKRNAKRAKEYYYKNHDKLKNNLKERAQTKRNETIESIKTVLDCVGEISLALAKIQDALKSI